MDNSGASYVECIKTLGGYNRTVSYPGDFILVSVKKLRLLRKVRVGQIHLSLITRTRKEVTFLDGSSSSSERNAIILMNKKQRVLGTRFFGWISRKLRRKKFLRILILCGRHVL
jgi:large subunit ribosomal protein L14